jgi:hypothetical protein
MFGNVTAGLGSSHGVWCVAQELSPVVTLVPDMMIPVAVSAIRRSIINQVRL